MKEDKSTEDNDLEIAKRLARIESGIDFSIFPEKDSIPNEPNNNDSEIITEDNVEMEKTESKEEYQTIEQPSEENIIPKIEEPKKQFLNIERIRTINPCICCIISFLLFLLLIGFYNLSNNLVKGILIIFIILSFLITLFFLSIIVIRKWKTREIKSNYDKDLNQLLKTYDKYIVTLGNEHPIDHTKEEYIVDSFKELIDVRNTVSQPILYYNENNDQADFYIEDHDKLYKYSIKRSDYDKK